MRWMRERRRTVIIAVLACVAIAAGPATTTTTTAPTRGDAVLRYLDQVIDWYRQVLGAGEAVGTSQELVAREGARENARRVVGLAFDFARAAAVMTENGAAAATQPAGASRGRTLAQLAAGADDRATRLQADVARDDEQIRAGAATTRPALTAERDRLAAQLELAQAQRDVLKQYAGFVTTAENGGDAASLSRKIEDLAASVPEARGDNATPPPQGQQGGTATPPASDAARDGFQPETAGVFALVGRIFTLSGRMSELSGLADQAQRLRDECERIRGPIRDQIIAAVRRGDVNGPATQAAQDPLAVAAQTRDLGQVATRFKQLAAAGVPLGEQEVLLDGARQNLLNWRAAIAREHAEALKYLLLRLGVMAGVILALIVVSELWRRATFRYVHDVRRRRQIMFVRRIVVAVVVALIVTASVVTEFGSLATFAGLITAGVAVALQAVILSGVAYFFFIGRFGVRVGDRVTIGSVTGDVVEVGILRLYLAELVGTPTDLHPSGRIVVFSNSVLFQPQAFYKQMPGANYVWHEVAFELSPETDLKIAERRLVGAVERVYEGYRTSLERGKVLSGVHVEEGELRPEGRLRFTASGVELVVRYPVEVKRAAEEDDRMTRELLAAIDQEPKLKLAAGGRMIQPA